MTAFRAPALDTARLTLRAPGPDDFAAYRAFYDLSDVTAGSYRGGRTDDEVRAILQAHIDHWPARGFGMWLLRTRDTGRFVGGAGISHPADWPSHELTWWLMPEARGTGYASEASRAVIGWACDTLGWPLVETHMRDENIPARRLAERLGGQVIRRETFPDGVTRDVFALPRGVAP